MGDVETVRASATEAKIIALNRDLAARLAAAPASAAPEPEGASAALFDVEPSSEAARYRDPYIRLIVAMHEGLVEALNDIGAAIGKLRSENAGLKLELAQLKGALAETTRKADTTDFVLQRLRLENKGDPGPPGPMGRDGRDGCQGPPGPKGSRGQRGYEISGWKIDPEGYRATPEFYDNSSGPALNLYPFFEQFNRDTEGDDVALATERAALSRASVELETERVRRRLPAR
jgi:hypothetical protein